MLITIKTLKLRKITHIVIQYRKKNRYEFSKISIKKFVKLYHRGYFLFNHFKLLVFVSNFARLNFSFNQFMAKYNNSLELYGIEFDYDGCNESSFYHPGRDKKKFYKWIPKKWGGPIR